MLNKDFVFIASIIIFAGIFLNFLPIIEADARLVPKTILDHYLENDLILIAKIISLSEDPEKLETNYFIDVEKYLKSPQDFDKINIVGYGIKNNTLQSSITRIFDVEDRVLLFLNKEQTKFRISPYSTNAESFDPDLDFILPPLKLYKAGIPASDIVCRGDLKLVVKSTDGSPACVKSDHVERLIKIGWAHEIP